MNQQELSMDEIIRRMHGGWTLGNRGTGWWLSSPQKRNQPKRSIRVADNLVDQMVNQGKIYVEIPHTAAIAYLEKQ